MRITKSKVLKSAVNITLASSHIIRTENHFNNKRLALTLNKVFIKPKTRREIKTDPFITEATIYTKKIHTYLTDSWQILGEDYIATNKQSYKWHHTVFSMSPDKEKHTHLTKANYNTFN